MYNSNNNLVENISFIFLLLNMGYFLFLDLAIYITMRIKIYHPPLFY